MLTDGDESTSRMLSRTRLTIWFSLVKSLTGIIDLLKMRFCETPDPFDWVVLAGKGSVVYQLNILLVRVIDHFFGVVDSYIVYKEIAQLSNSVTTTSSKKRTKTCLLTEPVYTSRATMLPSTLIAPVALIALNLRHSTSF